MTQLHSMETMQETLGCRVFDMDRLMADNPEVAERFARSFDAWSEMRRHKAVEAVIAEDIAHSMLSENADFIETAVKRLADKTDEPVAEKNFIFLAVNPEFKKQLNPKFLV